MKPPRCQTRASDSRNLQDDRPWKGLQEGDTPRLEWPMPDHEVRLWPEPADGFDQVTDAY